MGLFSGSQKDDVAREASIRLRLLAEINANPQNTTRIAALKAEYRTLSFRTLSLPVTDAELEADADYRTLQALETAPPPTVSDSELDGARYQAAQARIRQELQERAEQAAAIRERLAFKFPERFAARAYTPPPPAANSAADAARIIARRLRFQILAVVQAISGEQRSIIVRELREFLSSLEDKNV